MKLKKLLSLALVGAMTLGLAACGGNADKPSNGGNNSNNNTDTGKIQDVTLVVWGAEEDQTMLKEMCDAFIEANKDKVNLKVELGVQSESNCKDTVMADVEAAADIYSFPNDQLADLVAAGALLEVPKDQFGDVWTRNTSGSVAAGSVGDKLYAFPRTADNGYFLFYNKAYFTEDDISSWDKLLDAAAKAGKKASVEIASGWYTFGFFRAAGLNTSVDGKNTLCDYNSTTNKYKGTDVAQALLDIAKHPGYQYVNDAAFATGVKDGTIIAGVNGTWNASVAEEAWGENYAAAKLPTFKCAGDELQMYSVTGCKLIGVNPNCDNAAWALKLADWLTNEQNQIKSFEMRGNGPSNINAGKSEAVLANVALAAFYAQQQWAEVQYVGGNYWTPMETFGKILVEGNPEGKSLQELLDNAVAGVTAPVE